MEGTASNTSNSHSPQLNTKVAIGKRKGESHGPGLSLQDVFSDPGNLAGRQQKTLASPEPDRRKLTQLKENGKGKSKKTNAGGRRKLPAQQLKKKKLQMYVTEDEYIKFQHLVQASGKKTMADLLRALVLDKHNSTSIINNVALIKQLDSLGTAMNRIGNNMNQLAKYANIQLKSGKVDLNTMIKYTGIMEKYMKERRELTNAYRALVRK